jgi:hypothetical protein
MAHDVSMVFDEAGPQNTEATLKAAFDFAQQNSISPVVVASTSGKTGAEAAEIGKERGTQVVVVTHNFGFAEPGQWQVEESYRKRIQDNGACLYTGSLVLRGLGSAIRKKLGYSESELVANILRLFGQGMKVCVEMAAMAADGGHLGPRDAIFAAGTGQGADTAAVIRPAPSNQFFDIKVRRILAKPRDF